VFQERSLKCLSTHILNVERDISLMCVKRRVKRDEYICKETCSKKDECMCRETFLYKNEYLCKETCEQDMLEG